VEGLIHLSELSWDKRVRKPGDLLKVGGVWRRVVLQSQRDGAPHRAWDTNKCSAIHGHDFAKASGGLVVEGPITNVTEFGAFAGLAMGLKA